MTMHFIMLINYAAVLVDVHNLYDVRSSGVPDIKWPEWLFCIQASLPFGYVHM